MEMLLTNKFESQRCFCKGAFICDVTEKAETTAELLTISHTRDIISGCLPTTKSERLIKEKIDPPFDR